MGFIESGATNISFEFNREGWRERARCIGTDPIIFHPDESNVEDNAKAKAVCDLCEVRVECLEYALAAREKDGVWGGMSAGERKKIINQRRRVS